MSFLDKLQNNLFVRFLDDLLLLVYLLACSLIVSLPGSMHFLCIPVQFAGIFFYPGTPWCTLKERNIVTHAMSSNRRRSFCFNENPAISHILMQEGTSTMGVVGIHPLATFASLLVEPELKEQFMQVFMIYQNVQQSHKEAKTLSLL